MICKNCGFNNHTGAKFCGGCGAKIDKEIVLNQDVISVSNSVSNLEDGFFFKGVSFPKKILIYALGIFLVFFIAMYTFAVTDLHHFVDMISYLNRFVS